MKHATSIFAIALAVSLIGCQENNVIEPTPTSLPINSEFGKIAFAYKVATFKGSIPHPGWPVPNNKVIVSGQVTYAFHRTPSSDEGIYNLEINTTAVLRKGLREELLSVDSDRIVQVSGSMLRFVSVVDGLVTIEQKFEVREYKGIFHLELQMISTTLNVNRMWITADREQVPVADNH